MYQCNNGAIPSRKCSIKTPAKWRNSAYVLIEICHQSSKWLGPKGIDQIKIYFTYLHISDSSQQLTSENKNLLLLYNFFFHACCACTWGSTLKLSCIVDYKKAKMCIFIQQKRKVLCSSHFWSKIDQCVFSTHFW